VVLLVVGLVLFGIGDWLFIESRFGNTPWTVLADGLAQQFDIGIGVMTVIISFVVLAGWAFLRQRPGLGTIGNAIIIGTTVQLLENTTPEVSSVAVRVGMMVLGLVTVGVGGALYLSTRYGPGPRDGLMTGIGTRFEWPIARVRLGIEITVMVLGVLLGGRLGFGTLFFALGIGHVLAFCVARLHRLDRHGEASSAANRSRA
jgi:uncharacterized membrane protein YczE